MSTYLSKWTQLTYTFYDGIFFDHTSLKILADAKASSAFFALSSRKICSFKKGTYYMSTYLIQNKFDYI